MLFNKKTLTVKNIRQILTTVLILAIVGIIAYSPISQKAFNNVEDSYKLSFDMQTIKMIAGQSVKVKLNIERNGFEEPITLKAENLPDGFEVEFEENPVEGNSANAWIYSPVNVLQCENTIVIDSYENPQTDAKLRVLVNCGIEWDEQFGTASGDAFYFGEDVGNAVATNDNGDVFVVGKTFDLSSNQSDVWLAKYSNDGTQEWIQYFGSEAEDSVTEVATDNQGGVFVGGYTEGAMPSNSSNGNVDYWIAKYDDSGNQEWIRQGGTNQEDGRYGIAIIPDNQGGARLATIVNAKSGVATFDYDSNGGRSILVGEDIPIGYRDTPYDLALSENGDLYIVGFRTQGGEKRGYVIKYDVNDSSNNELWKQDFTINGDRVATRVVTDQSGDLYVAGFDEIDTNNNNQVDIERSWFTKMDGNGNFAWTNSNGQSLIKIVNSQNDKKERIRALGVNNDGDLIVAGNTEGVLGTRNGGGEDAWSSRYDSGNGDLIWMNQYAVNNDDSFEAVAFDSNDGVILAGRTIEWKSPIGSTDALLVKFIDAVPHYATPNITNAYQDPQFPGFLRIEGALINITDIRINGIPLTVFSSSPGLITIAIPQSIPTGNATLSVTANCRTVTRNITIK